MTAEPLLELSQVSVRSSDLIPAGDGTAYVLRDVSLRLAAGGTLSLLGESGGGKSTLLRLPGRLIDAAEGSVRVQGRPVSEWAVPALRRTTLLVTQEAPLFGGSVADELRRPLRWAGRDADDAALRAALDVAGLKLPLDRAGEALSGGERLRLTLARALLLEPKLLLLDEPTGALDVRTARELLGRLRAWADAGGAGLLVVTHRPEDLRLLGGEGAVLLGGRLHGPFPAEALAAGDVDDPEVRAFLGTLDADPEERP